LVQCKNKALDLRNFSFQKKIILHADSKRPQLDYPCIRPLFHWLNGLFYLMVFLMVGILKKDVVLQQQIYNSISRLDAIE